METGTKHLENPTRKSGAPTALRQVALRQESRRPEAATCALRQQPCNFPQFPRKFPQCESLILPNIADNCCKLLGEKKVPATRAALINLYLPPSSIRRSKPLSCLVVADRPRGEEARPRIPASKRKPLSINGSPTQSNQVKPHHTGGRTHQPPQLCIASKQREDGSTFPRIGNQIAPNAL
jgi:hypothetical protein